MSGEIVILHIEALIVTIIVLYEITRLIRQRA